MMSCSHRASILDIVRDRMSNETLRRNALECKTRDGIIDAIVDPDEAVFKVISFVLNPANRIRINAVPRGKFAFTYGGSEPTVDLTFIGKDRIRMRDLE